MTLPAAKSTAMCYTMSLADFNSLFLGRMREDGNEREVREVVRMMASSLHLLFPTIIAHPDNYLKAANKDKYSPSNSGLTSSALPEGVVAETILTPQTQVLLRRLNLPSYPTYVALSELASRITYLSFPNTPSSVDQSIVFLRRMAFKLCHLSVFACVQYEVADNGSRAVYSLKQVLESVVSQQEPSAAVSLIKQRADLLFD